MRNIFVTLSVLAASGMVFAATTGELILSGLVDTVFEITVTPAASATQLDIEGGESGTNVASVNEQSNNPGGYKITIASDNDGKLVHDTDANSFVNYQVSYDGGANVTPTTAAQTVKTVASLATPADADSDVTVTFTGKTDAIGGTYSDRLVFEISAP